ncbi:MAG: GyrI-like domain-containing protein [Candidatus Bathyarchaeota archaeon]|nr:GyrI-like domain-containing protein [Candidatus Bathyarchaeota archaeon]
MEKIDYKKELKDLYNPPSKQVVVVDVPAFNFLMIDGQGDPNGQEYHEAVEALFAVSYALKFMIKKGKAAVDYGVLPLEGLWWADDANSFVEGNRDAWKWTSLIMQPEHVTKALFREALEQTQKKKNLPALPKMRFESFREGLAAQTMHLGPYAEEHPTIEKIHSFIQANGYEFNGKHHEIYLSDPRKAAPEKMKTVLRQPIKKK